MFGAMGGPNLIRHVDEDVLAFVAVRRAHHDAVLRLAVILFQNVWIIIFPCEGKWMRIQQ